MSELVYVDLGQCNYRDTLALQHRLVDRVRSSDDDRAYLILVEHAPAVITLGRRAKAEHVLNTEAAELIESRRGGDVTWHGPGQLVAYPIVRLSGRRKRLSGYVRNLEEAVIALLAKFDLNAGRQSGQVGVWIDGQKISAIGVAVKRWITYHGLALNVSADLRGFDAIVPCGIQDASITSISQLLGRDVPISQVKDMLIETLAQTLEFDCRRRATPQELKTPRKRLPHWLRREIPTGSNISEVQTLIEKLNLSTVCQSAHCPNRVECFSQRTATFMILGDRCTRSCSFCAVEGGAPLAVDPGEADAVAAACKHLNLRHVVITSVTRDDLPDGGVSHFARVVHAVREQLSESTIEILTPDFQGDPALIDMAVETGCDVFNHNIETVERMHQVVRPQGNYQRSLSLLAQVSRHRRKVRTKSGIMVGLGETRQEVRQVMHDLRDVGCEIITIGQYLAPSENHYPVDRFVEPDEFVEMQREAHDMGFSAVASGALVRSSYRSGELLGA